MAGSSRHDVDPGAVAVTLAGDVDVVAICEFGERYIPDHYTPLIGEEAARKQIDAWWQRDRIAAAVAEDRIIVAKLDGEVVGVAEWSEFDGAPVVWKFYLADFLRGKGIGRRLLDGIIDNLPPRYDRLCVEHFAANEGAGRFYEREGFVERRIEPSPTNDSMNIVWRERRLSPH